MRLLTPIPPDRRPRRFAQLLAGLVLYGFTMGLMVRAVLGLDPWDVFHQGLTALVNRWIPLSYGAVITIVSVLVLLLWIPLRQRPGIGTVANAAIIGFTVDLTLWVIPPVDDLTLRIGLLVVSVAGNALAGALYIGAGLGPGPRDGLMTGLVARGIGSVRVVRTAIEVTVLGVGWVLGGVVGVGTVVYALAIGPLLHVLLPRLQVGGRADRAATSPELPDDVIYQEEAR
ncbi:YczE/YyaS/YitT family protein [Nakamurella sp.]|uniref:membrane protein YczE n=1 Tax=Nakamurella sp. TaxID=1869182 RepID=UPI003B3AA023